MKRKHTSFEFLPDDVRAALTEEVRSRGLAAVAEEFGVAQNTVGRACGGLFLQHATAAHLTAGVRARMGARGEITS